MMFFFFLCVPAAFFHHHTLECNEGTTPTSNGFLCAPFSFFPIDSLNTMKISFAIKFSRLRQRVHGTLREMRLVEREKCKREKKKKEFFE
jgi:hypothetical protein